MLELGGLRSFLTPGIGNRIKLRVKQKSGRGSDLNFLAILFHL